MGFDKEVFKNDHRSFDKLSLNDEVPNTPFILFEKWLQEAQENKILDYNAMTISTVNKSLEVSSRVVYLKDVIEDQFIFFTNYSSKKGQDIAECPNVSILFFWKELERQIRIQGVAKKVSDEVSESYFNSRPYASKIGAIASEQSAPIDSRTALQNKFEQIKKDFPTDESISRPMNWGGYAIEPTSFEFWQGREHRLHDRIAYKQSNDSWNISRLNP